MWQSRYAENHRENIRLHSLIQSLQSQLESTVSLLPVRIEANPSSSATISANLNSFKYNTNNQNLRSNSFDNARNTNHGNFKNDLSSATLNNRHQSFVDPPPAATSSHQILQPSFENQEYRNVCLNLALCF